MGAQPTPLSIFESSFQSAGSRIEDVICAFWFDGFMIVQGMWNSEFRMFLYG